MIIAQQKRKENIAEYLLYMWQIEDLLRACQLDDARIDALLVSRFQGQEGVTPEQLEAIRTWYHELADMMRTEGKREHGHLQINENILIDLTDLHLRLLKHGQDAIYTSAFYATLPYIVELRSKEGDAKTGELETCFTALYGVLMLRLQGKPITPETEAALRQISKFIGFLAAKYKLWKAGELKFDDDEEVG
jgi:hypothetical protein